MFCAQVTKIAFFFAILTFSGFTRAYSFPEAEKNFSVIVNSSQSYEGPNISDNADSMVFRGKATDEGSAIFISEVKSGKDYSFPHMVVNQHLQPQGTQEYFADFFSPIHSTYSTNYNSPMIENGLITFGASLINGTQGLFYAAPTEEKIYHSHPIVLVDHNQFETLDAPYISKGLIYFLAADKLGNQTIYRFQPDEKPVSLITTNGNELSRLWDISVNENNIAFRATNNQGYENIYLYYSDKSNPVKISPNDYAQLTNSEEISLGGPSLYAGQVAYTVFYYSKNGTQKTLKGTGIYTNALGHKLHETVVTSGNLVPNAQGDYFIAVGNPTLYIANNKKKAYIAFQGLTNKANKKSGIYLAQLTRHSVYLSSIITPGQNIGGKTVDEALLGAVSLRKMVMPVYVTFTDGTYAIVTVKIG